MKKRILIKISGASLKGADNTFEYDKVIAIAQQIKELTKKYLVSEYII